MGESSQRHLAGSKPTPRSNLLKKNAKNQNLDKMCKKAVKSTCQAPAESQTGAGGARFYQPPLSYTPVQFNI